MSETQEIAVLDRFEETEAGDEVAVLLLEADGEVYDEMVIARSDLPEDGRHQDAVFTVDFIDGEPVEFSYEEAETDARGDSTEDRFNRLSKRLSDEE